MDLEMSLTKILHLLENENLVVEKSIEEKKINYLSFDSRDIKENTLFFCKGVNYKEEYLSIAISRGAVAYISEKKYISDLCDYIIVNDISRAMAVVASEFYNHAYEDIETIGITGTKGKTTVTFFLSNILDEYTKSRNALISTVSTYTKITDSESHLTTPEALELHRLFYEAKISNLKYLTMEVTSQAYKKDRVYSVHFKNGMFLNVSEDHISDAEHPNFEDYLECKLKLIDNTDLMVINRDMDYFNIVMARAKNVKVVTYGKDNKADYYITNVVKKDVGFSFNVANDKLNYCGEFEIKMQGRFNTENALAATTMAKVLGVDDESIRKGLLKTEVMGRMNVFEKSGITVIVDYAHNALSFSKLYESIKLDYPGRRVISVGGAPGGKAYKRRQDFGEIVGMSSDYIYLTAEDPQFEEVSKICADIAAYIPEKTKYEVIEDRTEAVEKAIKNALEGDVVVLLAKGEEDYQKVRGVFTYYESDLKIAKRMLGID
ncbi:MAG: UDP-N-acetylmuramyl-tripeptide synthetase [Clostridia bacterium]|nr:UDP-N-acetylmuramyl-tripeptide synthetase [Clostridia bacterium]